jgi:predicted metal-binding membrane protein
VAHAFTIPRQRVASGLSWRPEWPVAIVIAAAWAALAALHASAIALPALAAWTLMVVAMMGPMALPAVRHVALNSLRVRRRSAIALYFAAYVAVWVGFGLVALGAELLATERFAIGRGALLAAGLALAAAWQITPVKRRALYACTRTVPLAPVGRKAVRACVRFALLQGRRSVVSCWALMFVMVALGHASLPWMVGLTAFVLFEELTLVGRESLSPAAVGLLLAAVLAAAGA